jgi:hypothetical protein
LNPVESKKNQMKNLFFIAFVALTFTGHAQIIEDKPVLPKTLSGATLIYSAPASPLHQAKYLGEANNTQRGPLWMAHVESEDDYFVPDQKKMDSIERSIKKGIQPSGKQNLPLGTNSFQSDGQDSLFSPILGTNFSGNTQPACPPDDEIAISNSGNIVSLTNSVVQYYNSSGSLLKVVGFENFFNGAGLESQNLCDPKSVYDPVADRFFFVCITCDGNPATSQLLLGFSKSNNPEVDGWNLYAIDIDSVEPGIANSWLDHPKVGVSSNDVFITGNLFDTKGTYDGLLVIQLNKNDGYNGQTLNYTHYHDAIPLSCFTAAPASYGQNGTYGPGIYMVSTSALGGRANYLYDITDSLEGSPSLNIYSVNVTPYSLGGKVYQKGGDTTTASTYIDNGDNRVPNAFYLNGIIHYVFCSSESDLLGYNGISYHRMRINSFGSTIVDSSFVFAALNDGIAKDAFDFTYPAVASFGVDANDETVVISCDHGGFSIYPETRAAVVNNAGKFSSSVLIKGGQQLMTNCYQSNKGANRWGDYTQIQRVYGASTPEAWMNGCYGASDGEWKSWVALLQPASPTGIKSVPSPVTSSKIFPNPSLTFFTMDFVLREQKSVVISIFDLQGKLVKELYHGEADEGVNTLTFNQNALAKGTYLITIRDDKNNLMNSQKILIQ